MRDLILSPHVKAAIYFTDRGDFVFKWKDDKGSTAAKSLRAPVVSAAFTRESTDSGWIGAGIQRTGFNTMGEWFVYFAAARTVMISLEKGKAVETPIPSTLLIGMAGKYHLFAMGEVEFDPGGKVYHAPFPNVHPDGRICWGNNAAPKFSSDKAGDAWTFFFYAPFNGDLTREKSKKHPEDVREQLKTLSGKSAYPVKDMRVYRNSLDDLMNELLKRRG